MGVNNSTNTEEYPIIVVSKSLQKKKKKKKKKKTNLHIIVLVQKTETYSHNLDTPNIQYKNIWNRCISLKDKSDTNQRTKIS